MFGDPVRNEKGWEKQKLGQLAKSRLGKMLDKEKPKGIHIRKYLANTNVQWFKIKFDSLSEMPFLDKELSELELKYGDLLICEGGEVGRTAIWKNEMPNVYFQKAIHRVRPDLSEVTSEYLAYFFWFTATITKFKKIVVTSTISHLTGEKLDKIQVPVPPIDLQKQFTHLVEKVEILRGRYTESLAELEKLYGSLSQLAFEGDLDLDFEVDENLLVAHEVAEQPQQIGDSLVFDEKALRYLIKNKLSGSFSFDTIWGAIQSADFATPPQYNDVKTLIFKWLNAKKPILTQTFHPTEKRLEFTLNK